MTNTTKSPAGEKAEKTAAAMKTEEVKAVVAPAASAAQEPSGGDVKAPAAEKKSPVKKTAPKAAKKAVEKDEKPAEKAEKKPAAKKAAKAEPKATIVVEYQGRQVFEADLIKRAQQVWLNAGKTDAIQEMNLYVKPEDGAVYCVINGETVGKFSF